MTIDNVRSMYLDGAVLDEYALMLANACNVEARIQTLRDLVLAATVEIERLEEALSLGGDGVT